MPFLLDTHAFLWFIAGDEKLPNHVKSIILDPNQSCFISIVSFWEIAIKKQIGKLKLELEIEELFQFALRNQIEIIQINQKHLQLLLTLDFIHKDPFDRMIIAQAVSENLILISKDRTVGNYHVESLWDEK